MNMVSEFASRKKILIFRAPPLRQTSIPSTHSKLGAGMIAGNRYRIGITKIKVGRYPAHIRAFPCVWELVIQLGSSSGTVGVVDMYFYFYLVIYILNIVSIVRNMFIDWIYKKRRIN